MNPSGTIILLTTFLVSTSLSGQSFIANVSDTVEIIVDRWGVPHIYADHEEDLFFAQGFNAARDRLFQFEIWRRQATGTVAQILGRKELKRDIGTRLFMFRGDLTQELLHYHPRGDVILSSFVRGVNTYIDWANADPENRLPLEFGLLDIKPLPWTEADVISRHQGLLGNINDELNIGRLVHLIGEEKVRELHWFHPFEPNLSLDSAVDGAHLLNDILELYDAYRKPVRFRNSDLGFGFSDIDDYDEPLPYTWNVDNTIGSNNWVVSGEHTQSEYPMMANDPHRTLAVPSLRYMCHLVGPGWNVIGGGEPEIPGISIGHNEYGAWGLTVFETDAEDLYVYRLNPDDSNQYLHGGEWHEMSIIYDTVPVKGEDPVPVEHRYTIHGPVVYIDSESSIGYAVRCGWLEVGGSPYLASLRMNQSIDFESFREACNYSHIPGENMVWIDRAGNIGWQAVGIAPVRRGFSGLVPIPGDGRYEWNDYLEIRKKPNLYNPPSGMIITANENLTNRDYPYPEAIGYSWSDPVRGDRVAELLGQNRKLTMTDMCEIQNDRLSIPARILTSLLSSLDTDEIELKKALELLTSWDLHLTTSSIEATIYDAWERVLKRELIALKVPEVARSLVPSVQYKIWLDWLIFPDSDFGQEPVKGRDKFLMEALTEAIASLTEVLGSDWSKWHYGQLKYKHVQISHSMSQAVSDSIRDLLDVGWAARGGNSSTVGNTSGNLNQSHGATFKIIVDAEDWDRCLASNAPGQSGNPDDKHYRDLFEMWASDQYFPLFFSRKKVESVRGQTIYLVPHPDQSEKR